MIYVQIWVTVFRLFPGFIIAWLIFLFQKNKLKLLKPLQNLKVLRKIIISSGLGTFLALTFWILGCLLLAYKTKLINPTENFKLGLFAATGGIFIVYISKQFLCFFLTQKFQKLYS